MESNENMEHTENYKYIMKCLKEIRLELRDLTHENIELKTRNKELKKENKKLHETILQMSQRKIKTRETYMERFALADNEMFLRDFKHMNSYSTIDELVDLLNHVDESDNCAVDLIKKELAEQEDENVKTVLMNILDSLEELSNSYD